MNKKDFQDKMYLSKAALDTGIVRFSCWALELGFFNTFHMGSGKVTVTELYTSIINGRNCSRNGMFGESSKQSNQDARMMSLEIFEQVMIDEKLYKEL